METTTATVKFKAMNTSTRRGERANVVITFPDGREGKIWGEANAADLFRLRKGQTVAVVPRGGSFELAGPTNGDAAPGEAAPANDGQPSWKDFEAYAAEQARLYELCFRSAAAAMEKHSLGDADLRAIASNLHISLRRRFDL